MSVINQMLKDLDQRRAQGFDNGTGMLDDLSGADGDDNAESSSNKVYWISIGLLLVVALGVGVFFYQSLQQKTIPVAVIEESPVNVLAPVLKPKPVLEIAPASTSVVKEIVVTATLDEPVIELVEPVQQATEPEVTKLVAEQLEPVKPVEAVIVPPVNEKMEVETILPSPLVANGSREIITVHGSGFVEPLKVTMEWAGGRAFKDLESWQIKVINKTEMQLHVNLGSLADDWRIIIKQLDIENFAEYKFNVVAEIKKPVEVVNEKTIEEAPSPKVVSVFNKTVTPLTTAEKVRLTYAEVTNSLQQGKITNAKKLLRKLLLLDFTHIQARQTLAALLFKEQQYDQAIEILELGRIQHPKYVAFTLLLARIHTERGQDPVAVDLLERLEPDVAPNSDYYALLAALYQRSAQYKKAASVYEKLLRVYPGRAVWWMGLGLSLQTTERKQDALLAYRKALATKGLTVELKRFIQTRMAILQQG